MGERPRKRKSKLLVLIVVAVIAIVVASVVVYRLNVGASDSSQLSDPVNDVVVSVGSSYPGMIDVVGASLNVNGTMLNVTIGVADSVSTLGVNENGQWNVTLILENDTDVLKTYVMSVNVNSSQFTGSIVDVDLGTVQSCQVSYYKNSLTAAALVSELAGTKVIEWNILTTYESFSGTELTTSASDLAPDQGLQRTVLGP